MRRLKLLTISVIISLVVNAQADEMQGTTITLTDIKEALYGLLSDSQANRKDIDKIFKHNRKVSEENVEYINNVNKKNTSFEKKIEKNTIKIKINKQNCSVNSKSIITINQKLKRMRKESILYKSEIELFIHENKELLPKG